MLGDTFGEPTQALWSFVVRVALTRTVGGGWTIVGVVERDTRHATIVATWSAFGCSLLRHSVHTPLQPTSCGSSTWRQGI
jgi:hypothetical protein